MTFMDRRRMKHSQLIGVEVACATQTKQLIIKLDVPRGTTAREAVELSAIQHEFPELNVAGSSIGIFGEVVADSEPLKEKDRVEIYRPLKNDPRDTRRSRAARGSSMGVQAAMRETKPGC
jgi:putative ubiquitin-RnfH superfamily antitoxin RatB of RatAB toxin-antitoxin module